MIFAVNIMIVGLDFIEPVFYKIFIDEVIIGREIGKILFVIAGYISLFAVQTIIKYIQLYSKNKLVNGTAFRVKKKIWGGYLRLPFSDYEHMSVGDMKMRLDDDTGKIGEFAERQSIYYIVSFVKLAASFIIIAAIDFRLTIFAVIMLPIRYKAEDFVSRREKKLTNSNRENDQKSASWLHTTAQGWRETRALCLERYQKRNYIRYLTNFAVHYSKWINLWVVRTLIFPKIYDEFMMSFGLYFIGGLLIGYGKLTIGGLLIFIMYYNILANAVTAISNMDAELQSTMPITDRLFEEIEKAEIPRGIEKKAPNDDSTIVFDNVSFAYPGSNHNVLDGINLKIDKGERVAIAGKSGCGKTTLLKLLVGMLMPDSGSVSFSGIDVKDVDIEAFHKKIGYVMQENMLFNVSIRENMLLGKEDATDEEIYEACKKAYIYDTIVSLPKGLDTMIGERGIKLSGGQKQRLVLARLFLRNVDIFIFDEATSALDQYSENIIHDAIRHISDDKTIIVVAHRESSIRLCDRKIVLA